MNSPNPKNMKWCIIQNCYIHDNLSSDEWRNHDGILIQSAADGIVFNCYFENWKHGDGALDVSHRRTDGNYKDHFFRIERNIFNNCTQIKTTGNSDSSCSLIFCNNLYINTSIVDYHRGWDIYYLHETFVFNNKKPVSYFFKLWEIDDCAIYFTNCFLYAEDIELHSVYYQSGDSKPDDYIMLQPDYFVYLMPPPKYWLKGKGQFVSDWSEWKKGDKHDSNSLFMSSQNSFVASDKDDFRLIANSPIAYLGSSEFLDTQDPRKSVTKDFYGKSRYPKPSVGAFEMYEVQTKRPPKITSIFLIGNK